MSGFVRAGAITAIDGETVNATATVNSDWFRFEGTNDTNLFFLIDNASTAPKVTVYLDFTPLGVTLASSSTDTTKYVSVALATDATTKNAMQVYTTSTTENALTRPFVQGRVRVVGGATNGTDTVITVWLVRGER